MSERAIDRRWFCLPVVALVLAGACAKGGGEAAGEKTRPQVAAATALVTEQPFTETIGAIGAVQARAGHFAALSAPAPARVASVLVTAGQTVTKGQALVEFEHAAFQAAAQSAEAALTAAQLARDRAQRLVDQGVSARRDVEQADAGLARARADAVAARRLAELAVMRSPINGVVTRMGATLGGSADATQPLVEIADPSALDVLLSLKPADAARIHVGSKVNLHTSQRASDETLATGEVVGIAGVVDSVSRAVAVRVRVVASTRRLRLGETVFGDIIAATRPRARMIPLEALVPEGDGFKVFVVDSGDIAHARPVTVGGRTDQVAEILKGLEVGERVVTHGAFGVDDSVKIVAPGKAGAAAGTDAAKKP